MGGTGQAADDRAGRVGRRRRPPVEPAEERLPERQQRRPAVWRRGVEQQGAAVVAITLPGRAQPLVDQRGGAVDHRAEPLPDGRAQRAAGRLGLHRREQPEFGDEALVVRGELAADTGREGVAEQLALEQTRGLPPPASALREPREGAAGHELPGRLGDDVVVGRRAPAPERGQVLLVPADLLDRELVVARTGPLTPGQSSSRRRIQARLIRRMPTSMPLVQCTPDRNGFSRHQERSWSATRRAYASSLAEEPGRGQQRQVLQPGDLPDLLDVAGLLLRAVVDPERVAVRRRAGGR